MRVLLTTPYLEGQVDVFNLPENSYDLLRLPEPVLNAVRRLFAPELGARLLGPGGVALYPFGEHQYAIYNMTDAPAKVALRLPPAIPAPTWKELLHGKVLATAELEEGHESAARKESEVALTLLPFEIVLLESR